MDYSPIIKQMGGTSDNNISIYRVPDEETLSKLNHISITGVLTYKPEAFEICGIYSNLLYVYIAINS